MAGQADSSLPLYSIYCNLFRPIFYCTKCGTKVISSVLMSSHLRILRYSWPQTWMVTLFSFPYEIRYTAITSVFPYMVILSLPRVVNFKFALQPHQKYYITQYEELGFTQTKDYHTMMIEYDRNMIILIIILVVKGPQKTHEAPSRPLSVFVIETYVREKRNTVDSR